MTRLYYTDITKVLYMMRNFGVEFECIEECVFDGRRVVDFGEYGCEHESVKDFLETLDLPEGYPGRLYVKRESEFIYIPEDGDVSLSNEASVTRAYIYEESSRSNPEGSWNWGYHKCKTGELKTNFRDGKLFFAPEVEGD